ncbi:hypothetical protein HPB51_014691 [Rhipicephalus microplus]|uniref:Uncharacterized protein n=1 Tax=Rhipicephalus microplus TaxID=6941 RepID=A0A9J6F3N4_RHIMP|nr:hypothetical protein HPB51_014691 [Rhipicephalus microplus]
MLLLSSLSVSADFFLHSIPTPQHCGPGDDNDDDNANVYAIRQACAAFSHRVLQRAGIRDSSRHLSPSAMLTPAVRQTTMTATERGDDATAEVIRQRKAVADESDAKISDDLWPPTSRLFPSFDNSTERNVTSQLGQTAYLHCIVNNLGDKTRPKFPCRRNTVSFALDAPRAAAYAIYYGANAGWMRCHPVVVAARKRYYAIRWCILRRFSRWRLAKPQLRSSAPAPRSTALRTVQTHTHPLPDEKAWSGLLVNLLLLAPRGNVTEGPLARGDIRTAREVAGEDEVNATGELRGATTTEGRRQPMCVSSKRCGQPGRGITGVPTASSSAAAYANKVTCPRESLSGLGAGAGSACEAEIGACY